MGSEDPTVPQEVFDHMDIGKELENKFSENDYSRYPLSTENLGVLAIYGTNESWFTEQPTEKLHGGMIVGIGAGNIFSMIELYDKNDMPNAILSCDTEPEVVLAGRLLVQGLLDSDTETDMCDKMRDKQKVLEYYNRVLNEEKNQNIRDFFEKKKDKTFSELEKHLNDSWEKSPFDYVTDINLPKIFRTNFNYFKDLAHAGNFGFILTDINNSQFIDYSKEKQIQLGGDTLIYLTNAIDHITDRGYNLIQDPNIIQNPWAKIKELKNESSYFVDTLQHSLKYHLRFGKNIPSYTFEDFPIDPRVERD